MRAAQPLFSRQADFGKVIAAIVMLAANVNIFGTDPTEKIGPSDAHQKQIDRAKELLELLAQGNFPAFVDAGEPALRQALDVDGLRKTWEGLEKQFGTLREITGATTQELGEYIVVDLGCIFTKAPASIRITLSKDMKAAGLFIVPPKQASAYQPPAYADSSKFRETELTVSAGEFSLPGTLTLPNADQPVPGVVLVHGSGPLDRDETVFQNKPFADLAWGLASRGVAVFRYDKRTFAHARALASQTVTLQTETIDDALAACRLLMQTDGIDRRRVLVLGHSLGAMAAPKIAQLEPGIAGVIMLAAPMRPIQILAEEQVAYIAGLDEKLDDDERTQLAEIRERILDLQRSQWKQGTMLLGAPLEYWASLERAESIRMAKSIDVPMLILQGGRDYQVSAEKDFDGWRSELAKRPNTTFKLFPKLDHLFRSGESRSTPAQYQEPGHVDEQVITFLASWIAAISPHE